MNAGFGYTNIEPLHESESSGLYRGRNAQGQQVLLRLIRSPHPAPRDLQTLQHEFDIARDLASSAVVRPIAIADQGDRSALVLEDQGGQMLDRLLGLPMPLDRFLPIAVGLASSLAAIHAQHVIHKDIRPQNIVVGPEPGVVRLTGFGIATLMPRELPVARSLERLEGTLAYMSPEQTGRMNRSVDYRTDLYSLGVTLYQMLAGKLPCEAEDALGIVHCHIARTPVSLDVRRPDLPPILSAIVMRLLAKAAEDRYQSAHGLQADLATCMAQWRTVGRIGPFPLGRQDVSDQLHVSQELVGRQAELGTLLRAFDRVVRHGTPEFVLVTGYSGIGKSSLVHELHKPLVRERGFFATGKFDRLQRNVPYVAVIQAMRELIGLVLTEDDATLAVWRRAILEAVGNSGQLVVDLVPEAALIIGPQPKVPAMPPVEAEHRLHRTLSQFIGVFASEAHPVVLFLDDLQWLDSASLKLLVRLITAPEVRYLLLIGACRENEVGPSHPLTIALDELRQDGAPVSALALPPLPVADVTRMVAETCHCDPKRAAPLADLVHAKTGGNPFFVNQFLTSLHQEGLLRFDPGPAAWVWDIAGIRAKGYTDNVIDLMVTQLRRLPEESQTALELAASIGSRFPLETLAVIGGQAAEATAEALRMPVREGLVVVSDTVFAFAHDRVQEAAYSMVPADKRAAMHLHIGRILLAQDASDRASDWLFEVVNHLNLGRDLITGTAEREQLARLNLEAGRAAKASAAYDTAAGFFATGASLLAPGSWDRQYDLTYALLVEHALCGWLTGNFDVAERLVVELRQHARSKTEQAAIHRLGVDVLTSQDDLEGAMTWGLQGLRLLGIDLTPHPTWPEVAAFYDAVWRDLGERAIESLIDLPPLTDPDMAAALDILAVLFAAALNTDPQLPLLCYGHMVAISLRYGHTDASAIGYAYFGMVLGASFGRFEEGYRFGRLGIELLERQPATVYAARINFVFGDLVLPWSRHLRQSLHYLDRAFSTAVEAGDLTTACYCCNHIVVDRLILGDPLVEVAQEAERRLDYTATARFDASSQVIAGIQRLVRTLRGDGDAFDDAYDQAMEAYDWPVVTCWYAIMKLQARFLLGDLAGAAAAASRAAGRLWSSLAHIQEPEYWYFAALALAAGHRGVAPAVPDGVIGTLTAHRDKLGQWAAANPENFAHKHALVAAELARIEGQTLAAEEAYERAIRSARSSGFGPNVAIGFELAARFFQDRGMVTAAHAYLSESRYAYERWGAAGKVRQLEQQHPWLAEPAPVPAGGDLASLVAQMDATALIKASQAISSEIVLDRLLQTLMQVVIAQAGAQRGYLVLCGENGLSIAARADIDEPAVDATGMPATGDRLPLSLLHYVKRTREMAIVGEATHAGPFATDPYFVRQRPRSVLCLPIVRNEVLIGLIYLENNLVGGAFTPEKQALLDFLSRQVAISLENALLYQARQQAEATERRAREAAEEAVRLRDEFLSVASHELRTPLTSLQFAVQRLRRLLPSLAAEGQPAVPEKAISLAERQIQRMTHLIGMLLDVSRIQAGSLEFEFQPVDLAALVRQVAEDFEGELARAHSDLRLTLPDSAVGCWDRSRLEQVVINLLANAVKFGAGKPIGVTVETDGTIARLIVADQGIGIAPAEQERVFERFRRAVSSRNYGGLGLGLYITRRNVAGHGGTIAVSSSLGAGARFVVELPCAGPPTA
jgi:predicted ATPase/signal transduction histidine kinase